MFEAPLHEIASPEEQLAVARSAAIMAACGSSPTAAQRHFVEELMAKMMLLPEERDEVRREFLHPASLVRVAASVQNRQARIFLLYQAISVAFADNELDDDELNGLLNVAHAFDFAPQATRAFVFWVQDTIELSARGQELIVSL